ncbi:hypothetical protein Taro_039913 [Colocasia esculenta]|uniref:Transposase MuDR plant domain-containing protein n=1 Tax=Colocasia esculenta TaxID=4460 RepID=A0A843WBT2_COLES|nr:hypothetical protein [Colocasia esculenta]
MEKIPAHCSFGQDSFVFYVFYRMKLDTELTNYAIYRGSDWFYIKNDHSHVTARCKGEGCPWQVHASMLEDGPDFAIKTMNNVHTCGCDLKSQHHPRTSKNG